MKYFFRSNRTSIFNQLTKHANEISEMFWKLTGNHTVDNILSFVY